MLLITVLNGLHYDYATFADDPGYVKTYQNFGVLHGIYFLYEHSNGRVVSHLLALLLCPFMIHGQIAVAVIYLINVLLFTISLALFLRGFFAFRYGLLLSERRSFLLSILIYSIFFFTFFEKRFEWWFWLSSVTVYQYSLTLILAINGILLVKREHSQFEMLLLAIGFIAIGFMSEMQAGIEIILIATIILLPYINKSRIPFYRIRFKILAIILIAIPLYINFMSGGNMRKLRLSQTDFSNVSSVTKAISVVGNDLLCRWDTVIIHSTYIIKFNAIDAKLVCLGVLTTFLVILVGHWRLFLTSPLITVPKRMNVFSVFLFSLLIYVTSLLIPAFLYSNFVDIIFDRCKFMGSFMIMLSMVDMILIAIFRKRCSELNNSNGRSGFRY